MEPDLDRQAAALNMMQAGIGSLSGNTINQPTPFNDAKSNYISGSSTPGHVIHEQNRWEKAGGRGAYPVFDESWNPDTTPKNIPFRSDGVYPLMTTPFKKGWLEAGITNPNLGGAKVWNALSIDPTADDFFLRELYNYGKRYFPGYDAEQDEWRHKQYRDSLEEDYQEEVSVDDDNIAVQTLAGQGFSMDEIEQIMADRELQQMAGMDDSLQYLQQQINELDPNNPDNEDLIELLQSDIEMKYPWAV